MSAFMGRDGELHLSGITTAPRQGGPAHQKFDVGGEMIRLDCVCLDRWWGRLVPDRLPRTDTEFRMLHVVLCGLERLLAGETPTDPQFIEYVLHSPEVLRRMPVLESKTQ
jgi:hypothetical protein